MITRMNETQRALEDARLNAEADKKNSSPEDFQPKTISSDEAEPQLTEAPSELEPARKPVAKAAREATADRVIELPDRSMEPQLREGEKAADKERLAMEAAEKAYLEEYRNHATEVERAKAKSRDLPEEPDGLRERKKAYDAAREEFEETILGDATYSQIRSKSAVDTETRSMVDDGEAFLDAAPRFEQAAKNYSKIRNEELSRDLEKKLQAVREEAASAARNPEHPLLTYEGPPEPKLLTYEKPPELELRSVAPYPPISLYGDAEKNRMSPVRELKIIASEAAVRPQKEAMEEAEATYLAKYKEFHATKKFYQKSEPQELAQLKSAYDAARLGYANALQESASQRLIAGGRSAEQAEKVVARYNGYMRYREVARPAAERKLQARYEAIDSRKKGLVGKGLSWLAVQNHQFEQKHGKNKAKVYRAAASTVLVTGAIGAFGSVGLMALAGYGSAKFARALTGTFAGAAAGEGMAQLVDRVRQSFFAKDKSSFEKSRRTAGAIDIEALERLDAQQEKITKGTDDRERHKQRTIVRALTAFGVGAGTAAALSELPAFQELAEPGQVSANDMTPAESRQILRDQVGEVERMTRGQVAPQAEMPEAPKTGITEPSVPSDRPSVEAPHAATAGVLERGDGANELLYELRSKLIAQYGPDLKGAPEYVKHFVHDENMLERSRDFGFMTEDGSVLVHENATLSFDADGKLVLDDPQGVGKVALMDADGETIKEGASKIRGYEHLGAGESSPTSSDVGESPASDESPLPATSPTLEQNEAVTDGGIDTEPPSDSMNLERVSEAPDQQTPTEAPRTSAGAVPMEEWVSDAQTQDPAAPVGPAPDSVPEPVRPVAARPLGSGPVPLEEWVAQNSPLEASSEPMPVEAVPTGAAVTEWAPGTPLPAEPSAFSIQGAPNGIFFHGAGSPEQNFQMAQEYARTHPGTRVYFENPQTRWGGLVSPVARTGSVEFDQRGNLARFEPQALDEQGKPVSSLESRLMRRVDR